VNICTNPIFLDTSIIDLHSAMDSFCLSSFKFFWQASKDCFISARLTFRPFKVVHFGANRKRIYDFLLVPHSNLGPILHCFGDFAGFLCSWPHPYSTLILGCSRCIRSPMLGSART